MAYDRTDFRAKARIERTAAEIRGELGLDQIAVLDPVVLLAHVDAELFYVEELVDDPVQLRRVRSIAFDGLAFTHPESGRSVILLNCGKPERRQRATLMEELAHILLKHRPSRVALDPDLGVMRRTFDRAQENEAYDLGCALLLPKERIQRDVKDQQRLVREIADEHGCSHELVSYRIKRARLWRRYQLYAAAA